MPIDRRKFLGTVAAAGLGALPRAHAADTCASARSRSVVVAGGVEVRVSADTSPGRSHAATRRAWQLRLTRDLFE
jgi:hypothetical protein